MDATIPVSSDDDSANQEIARQYDERPYASEAFFYSSPAHIQAVAHLYGVAAPAPHRARVLEIGCAAGGNLLPFALAYPDAEVVGVDLSPVQIEAGRRVLARTGVKNLTLHAMSLTDIGPEFGKFDYIIAHGVFSWIPPAVREALMKLCHTNLTDEGVAYISYNTYPGWKAGDIIRDAMTLHVHGLTSGKERVESARAVINMFKQGTAGSNTLGAALGKIIHSLDRLPDYYLEHEYLETFNSPCYLVEFADLAMRSGLDHMGDAQPQLEISANYGQNVQLNLSLTAIGQPRLVRQQYLDFLVGQNFRKSLLVQLARQAEMLHQPDPARASALRLAAHFDKVDAPADVSSQNGEQWLRDQNGVMLCADNAATLAVTELLSQAWPRSLTVVEIVDRIDLPATDIERAWLHLVSVGRVLLAQDQTPYDAIPQDMAPSLIPGIVALLDAKAGDDSQVAPSNLWHCPVYWTPDAVQFWTMRQMDGQRNEAALSKLLRDAWQQGIVSGPNGESLTGQRNLDALAQRFIRALLEILRRHALRLS
ncbi:methyltransferase regulatory domain-containing protein [Achromobacter pestifer]|uniref:Methyltransferase regulatory domain-containing protein n=1 Tax=Achromobacter pestifer TaxID=1353889 RepID=A0A7D4IDC3_9BURK|nr:methyltransferase regulatory domain-containing protein [Achromobacter pestifer]QKH39342.1 methyltransferase regulatory domain-containing protein [Achromobacter pestifer]